MGDIPKWMRDDVGAVQAFFLIIFGRLLTELPTQVEKASKCSRGVGVVILACLPNCNPILSLVSCGNF